MTYALASLAASPFTKRDAHKTWKRVVGDAVHRLLFNYLSIPQFQKVIGTDEGVYRSWAKSAEQAVSIETVNDETGKTRTRIFWIGDKDADKTILWLHGAFKII